MSISQKELDEKRLQDLRLNLEERESFSRKEVAEGRTPMKAKIREDGKIDLLGDPCTMNGILGTADQENGNHCLMRTARAISPTLGSKRSDEEKGSETINVSLQALNDQKPKDSIEARLIGQSLALFDAGMRFLERAQGSTNLKHEDSSINNATKLLRLHNETVACLQKYRNGGEQKVIVQHLNVNDGGRAIVGVVEGAR